MPTEDGATGFMKDEAAVSAGAAAMEIEAAVGAGAAETPAGRRGEEPGRGDTQAARAAEAA